MIQLKDGVTWDNVDPDFRKVLETKVVRAYDEVDHDMVITSLNDGKHMVGSLHYEGKAADLRIWGLKDPAAVEKRIAILVGTDFDVILEKDHIHVEYDPK